MKQRKPRCSKGVRRALGLISAIGWVAFEDPTSPWANLLAQDKRDVARALAWLDWQRTHNAKGQEEVIEERQRRRRRRKESLEQLALPLESPENRQDVERAV